MPPNLSSDGTPVSSHRLVTDPAAAVAPPPFPAGADFGERYRAVAR
jgi:hypothetical protein